MSTAARAIRTAAGVVILHLTARGIALDPHPEPWAWAVSFVVLLVYVAASEEKKSEQGKPHGNSTPKRSPDV